MFMSGLISVVIYYPKLELKVEKFAPRECHMEIWEHDANKRMGIEFRASF